MDDPGKGEVPRWVWLYRRLTELQVSARAQAGLSRRWVENSELGVVA